MASSPPHKVCHSSFSDRNHGRSKAQMSLKKIVDFITCGKTSEIGSGSFVNREFETKKPEGGVSEVSKCGSGRRGIDIDLNLRLGGPCFESENENKGFSACSGVGEDDGGRACGITSSVVFGDVKSSEGECDPKDEKKKGVIVVEDDEEEEEETRELSEITNLQVRSSEIETKQANGNEVGVEEQSKLLKAKNTGNNLDLLVEAARLISGNFDDDDEEEDEKKKKKASGIGNESARLESEMNEEWMMDGFEDISPVVRSKRGRNQVLPYRYRDSVIEPWKRLTRQRSSRKQKNK